MPVIAVTHGPSESDTGGFDWPRFVLTSVHRRSPVSQRIWTGGLILGRSKSARTPGLSSSLPRQQGREGERPWQRGVDRCTFTLSFDTNVILMLLSTGSW